MGDPLPPLANVPARVAELRAVQRGSAVLVDFSVPQLTTEGMAIPAPAKLDLRIGTAGDPFDARQWAEQAAHIPEPDIDNGAARYRIPAADWIGKDAIIGVRVIGGNGKASDWSPFEVVPVVPPPGTPRDLTAQATPDGVRLTWDARGDVFRVFRRAGEETAFTVAATVGQPHWTDPGTDFGTRYAYAVQTAVKLPNGKEAESERSEVVAVTPQDVFPPAAPKGLRGSPAMNSVELAWDANAEPYFASYRVYRSEGGGAYERIAEGLAVPAYSDRKIAAGKGYSYQVTAVSRTGYESERSAAIEVKAP